MADKKTQSCRQTCYSQRAGQRGNHARQSSGSAAIRSAGAFQRVTPRVVSAL
jgi:4-oxalomesaconate hydratase